jgi:putative holliday junction resolvase
MPSALTPRIYRGRLATLKAAFQTPVSKTITVLAFDYGTRRIGVAVGNSITGQGQALAPISADQDDTRFAQIAARIAEWAPDQLVVGLPCHPDGAEHAMTGKAQRFGNQLHGRFGLPVAWVDERYTSAVLENDPRFSNGGRKSKGASLDSESARLILEQYFLERTACK